MRTVSLSESILRVRKGICGRCRPCLNLQQVVQDSLHVLLNLGPGRSLGDEGEVNRCLPPSVAALSKFQVI